MVFLVYIFIFILGICIGSFLNVLIYRLPRNINFLRGRSFCPKCKKRIVWWENIPLFSYIFLGGKCSKCKVKISLQYPAVELATGILFLLAWRRVNSQFSILNFQSIFNFQFFIYLIYYFSIIAIFISIFFIDLKHYIIPDSLIVAGITTTTIYLGFRTFGLRSLAHDWGFFERIFPYSKFMIYNSLFINNIIFAIIGGGFFGLIILLTKGKGMGMGDAKLGILMGLILGSKLITALYLSFIIGAVVGVGLILFAHKNLKSKLPFGPFLVIATIMVMFL